MPKEPECDLCPGSPYEDRCPMARCPWANTSAGVCTFWLGGWCPNLRRRRMAEARQRLWLPELEGPPAAGE